MVKNYLKIQPIVLNGLIEDKTVNSIFWTCQYLERNATSANLLCELAYVPDGAPVDGEIYPSISTFLMQVPSSILETWLDDSVIDDYVLTYSPKFIKA